MLFTYPREQHKQEEADAKLGWTILPRRWGPIIRQEEKDETEAEEESELELELDLSIDLSDGEESDGSYYIYETDLLEDWQEEAIDEPASDADRTSETQSYSSIHETELIQLYMEGTTYE
jgi:hypothetical protein